MNRKDLVNKLTLANLTLADNAMVPMLQCFQFSTKLVVATDGSVGINIPCKTDKPFAVNGKVLLGLLSNSQAEEVEFSLVNGELHVNADKSLFKLPYLPEEDFMFCGEDKMKPLATFPLTEEFIEGIENCLVTASRDEAQQALMGVTISDDKKEGVRLCSCDGDALTRYSTGLGASGMKDTMLPNQFCAALIKISKEVGLGKSATLAVNSEWAKATLGGGHIVHGRVIENDNPLNHDDVIKKTFKGAPKFVKCPDGLNEALSRAQVVAKAESAKTVLTVSGGKLKLLTITHIGEVKDTVALPGHPDVTADVSAELMQRSLNICDEIAITDRCVAYRNGEKLFQIISNVSK
jgi:DNA polymerase III sliding clamp (beta) subunit (PCNA family)